MTICTLFRKRFIVVIFTHTDTKVVHHTLTRINANVFVANLQLSIID